MSRYSAVSTDGAPSGKHAKANASADPPEDSCSDAQLDDIFRRVAIAEREREKALRERDEALAAKEEVEKEAETKAVGLRTEAQRLQQRCGKLQGLAEELGAALKASQHEVESLRLYVAELEELVAANRQRKSGSSIQGSMAEELRSRQGSVMTMRSVVTDISTLEDELRQASGTEEAEDSGSGHDSQGGTSAAEGGEEPEEANMAPRPSSTTQCTVIEFLEGGQEARATDKPGPGPSKAKAKQDRADLILRKNRELRRLRRRIAELEGTSIASTFSTGVFDSLLAQVRELTRDSSRSPRGSGEARSVARSSVSTSSSNGRVCRVQSPNAVSRAASQPGPAEPSRRTTTGPASDRCATPSRGVKVRLQVQPDQIHSGTSTPKHRMEALRGVMVARSVLRPVSRSVPPPEVGQGASPF